MTSISNVLALDSTPMVGASDIFAPKEKIIAEIERVFGKDSIEKLIDDVKPSDADCIAFGKEEIVKKSYYQLKSGRVVELVTFKDGKVRCIGSFTYTPEECCREGWATYHASIDKDRNILSSQMPGPKDGNGGDWSCSWNCLQNLIYIKTGMKVTVKELMCCFARIAKSRADALCKELEAAQKAGNVQEVLERSFMDVIAISDFFSFDPSDYTCRFRSGSPGEQLLIGSKMVVTDPEMGFDFLSPDEALKMVKNYDFSSKGPIFLSNAREVNLIFAGKDGRPFVIDPHNEKRSSAYYSQKIFKEEQACKNFFHLYAQDSTGKTSSYRMCNRLSLLNGDEGLETLLKMLSEVQSEPLSLDQVFKDFLVLYKTSEEFAKFLPKESD